jgi:2-oxoglutarate ferredoxin oxidoreductase subunit alpha
VLQHETMATSVKEVDEHIVEFVSDSGEGAQTAGQMFGTVSAQMGNGVWTVEIIPSEIEPPPRSKGGTSGNRIRISGSPVTNVGEAADIVVAFNEQVLYNRISDGALREGTILFLENVWADSPSEEVRKEYAEARADFEQRGYVVIEVPMDVECRKIVPDPRRGKNMWALGMVSAIYERDLDRVQALIEQRLGRKGEKVLSANQALVRAGYEWARENIDFRYRVAVQPPTEDMVVMNGNKALALGVLAAGIEICSMYPITPATSVSHFLAQMLPKVGGFLHQAEDEIAAIGFALGAAYAGKTSVTVTSGPGLALKTEFIGLAVMAELPLVIIDVQRGSPSTGLPTRVEQGDLMAAINGAPGDAPKIVIAPSSIEECFHFVITARKLAETFRGPVLVLSDANLANGQTSFNRPVAEEEWLAPPIDQSAWDEDVPAYAWDLDTGLSQRPVPGQRGGEYVLTGLAHDQHSKVAYDSETNQQAMAARSRKLNTLQRSLKPPSVHGDDEGDLLIVGWGSTRGAIEEAVDSVRNNGGKVSSVILRFLSPLEPGLRKIFSRFKKVMTIELNYSDSVDDPHVHPENRRYSELALLLRGVTLCDVDCWSRVLGVPLPPDVIRRVIEVELAALERS